VLTACISVLGSIGVNYLLVKKLFKGQIKRAMSIIASQGNEVKAENKLREQVDDAVEDIIQGISMEDPKVRFAISMVEKFAPELDIDAQTISILLEHPVVKNIIGGYMGNKKTPLRKDGIGRYGRPLGST